MPKRKRGPSGQQNGPRPELQKAVQRMDIDKLRRDFEQSIDTFQAMQDYVLIEVLKRTETEGGIALPEGAKTGGLTVGRVVSVGPGALIQGGGFMETSLKVDDLVYTLFNGQGATIAFGKDKEKEYVLIRETQIYGRVRAEAVTA